MLAKAIQFLVDNIKWHCSSDEFKNEHSGSLNRLQTIEKKTYPTRDLASKPAPKSQRTASLFESMPRLSSIERKSVGHWCELSAAAARESRLAKVERAYESDFRSPTNYDVVQLDDYIANHARNSALVAYAKRSQPLYQRQENRLGASAESTNNSRPDTQNQFTATHSQEAEGAQNSIAPELYTGSDAMLFKMAQFDDSSMRASVASNENTPVAILWLLLDDEHSEVRMALLENEKLPYNILEKLQEDVNELIVRKAQSQMRKLYKTEAGIAFGVLEEPSEGVPLEQNKPVEFLVSKTSKEKRSA